MEAGLLLVPGPVPLHPRVQEELAKPALPHYGDAWLKAYRESQDLQRALWSTSSPHVFPLVGPGHAGLESIAFTFLRPKDRVVVVDNGFFGGRMAEVLRTHRIEVDLVSSAWGKGVDLEKLRAALKKPARAVGLIHNETSTGVTNEMEAVAEAAHDAGAFLIVDAVSSLGGIPFAMDDLKIDAAFSASQKCLAAPAGITPVAVARDLWDTVKPEDVDGWYLNLFTWDRYDRDWGDWHPTPTTVSSNLFYAFHRALTLIQEEGLMARYARHATNARRLRDGLTAMGFSTVASGKLISNTVTCVRPPAGVDANLLVRRLRDEQRVLISGGLGPLRGQTIRIGTMGTQAEPEIVDAALDAIRAVLKSS